MTRQISFVKNSNRGGVTNKEFAPNYSQDNPISWSLFVNANNLYGHAMSQPKPTGNFKFLSPKEIAEFHM